MIDPEINQACVFVFKESSIYQECSLLTENQIAQMTDLIEGLLGSPPKMEALSIVMEYLLLLHPAEQTFTSNSASSYFFLVSARDGTDIYKPRDWKLPDGYERYAPEAFPSQRMNANRLGSALRDVIVKWSDSNSENKDFREDTQVT